MILIHSDKMGRLFGTLLAAQSQCFLAMKVGFVVIAQKQLARK